MTKVALFIITSALVVGCGGQDSLSGWTEGQMPNEAAGLWVGDEKFIEEPETDPQIGSYCARAIFTPQANFLIWLSAPKSCEKNNIQPLNGKIDSRWFAKIALEDLFIEQLEQYQCLPLSYCDQYDITNNYDADDTVRFGRWEVLAKSCLKAIKRDNIDPNLYYCETRQINLLKRTSRTSGRVRTKVVSTIAYSSIYGTFTDSSWCPKAPVFTEKEILENVNTTEGSSNLVLVQNYTNLYDPCTWSCYEDTDGICENNADF